MQKQFQETQKKRKLLTEENQNEIRASEGDESYPNSPLKAVGMRKQSMERNLYQS